MTHRWLIRIGIMLLSVLSSHGQLDPGVLARVRNASAMITITVRGEIVGSGSGFVARSVGNDRLVITNSHVVADAWKLREASYCSVNVIFDSGTESQRSVRAQIRSVDPVRDLAALRVKGENLPEPIRWSSLTSRLGLGAAAYVFGFPLGTLLAQDRPYPKMAITTGNISKLQSREIQLDVDIHPGNSGGAIVDRNGQLIGVVVAKVTKSRIGLGIPLRALNEFVEGRAMIFGVRQTKISESPVPVDLFGGVGDPMRNIREVYLLHCPVTEISTPFSEERPMSPRVVELKLRKITHEFQETMKVSSKISGRREFAFQAKSIDKQGRIRYSQPVIETVDVSASENVVAIDISLDTETTVDSEPRFKPPPVSRVGDLYIQEIADLKADVIDCCWSDDGRYLFAVTRHGMLKKIDVQSLRATDELALGRDGGRLAFHDGHILASHPAASEYSLVDCDQMKVNQRLPNCRDLVLAKTGSDCLYRSSKDNQFRVGKFTVVNGRAKLSNWQPIGDPMGKAELCGWDQNRIVYRDGHKLKRVGLQDLGRADREKTFHVPRLHFFWQLGPNGRYVAFESSRTLHVRDLENSASDVFTVPFVGDLRALAFDPDARTLLMADNRNLVIISADGQVLADYDLPDLRYTKGVWVHPAGNRYVLWGNRALLIQRRSGFID